MGHRRRIVSDVPDSAFESVACDALRSLGYEIVGPERAGSEDDLWIIDEADLPRIAVDAASSVPVIVLTRGASPPPSNRRVVDSVRRPAPFQGLYAALQKALEATPRRSPRVATARPARCRVRDDTRLGAVVSLSEGGCLFRSDLPLPADNEVRLLFSLPDGEMLDLPARAVHRGDGELGMAFVDPEPEVRSTLGRYIMERLLEN